MRRIILISLAFAGCAPDAPKAPPHRCTGRSRAPDAPAATPRAVPNLPDHHPPIERDPPPTRPVALGNGVAAELHPAPEVRTRPRRRLDLDQLRTAMLQVSGGIGWTETRNNVEIDLFTELSATLGKPDYFQTTTEDLEPSALFLKFLDDASRSVCQKMAMSDLERDAGERVLLRHVVADGSDDEAAIQQNLAFLVRRFHGRQIPVDGPALATWAWLRESADFVTNDPVVAWQSVCVGLFTHPDFFGY
jgi:hypothetical protein